MSALRAYTVIFQQHQYFFRGSFSLFLTPSPSGRGLEYRAALPRPISQGEKEAIKHTCESVDKLKFVGQTSARVAQLNIKRFQNPLRRFSRGLLQSILGIQRTVA